MAFSMHLEAYVANLVPFIWSKVDIAFINPIVSIDIKSLQSLQDDLNFLALYRNIFISFRPFFMSNYGLFCVFIIKSNGESQLMMLLN